MGKAVWRIVKEEGFFRKGHKVVENLEKSWSQYWVNVRDSTPRSFPVFIAHYRAHSTFWIYFNVQYRVVKWG